MVVVTSVGSGITGLSTKVVTDLNGRTSGYETQAQ
jgi:hypothetical protein